MWVENITEGEWMDRLATCADSEWPQVLNDFIAAHAEMCSMAAFRALEHHKRSRNQFFEDAYSIALDELHGIAKNVREGARVPKLWAALVTRTQNGLYHFLCTEVGGAAATGMVAVIRRQSRRQAITNDLTQQMGRTPTTDEVIEESKRRGAQLKDASKQGAILSRADFVTKAKPVSSDDIDVRQAIDSDRLANEDRETGDAMKVGSQVFSRRQVVISALERCDEHSPEMSAVAHSWLGGEEDDYDRMADVADIVKETGLPRNTVVRLLGEVRSTIAGLLRPVSVA